MKTIIKDSYGEGVTVETTVIECEELGDIKAVRINTFSDSSSDAVLEVNELARLIEALQKVKEEIS